MAKARKFGKAQVEVSIKDRVGKGLDAIKKRMLRFGTGLQSIGGSITGIGAGAAAAFAGVAGSLGLATQYFASFGDEVQKTSLRLGMSAEALTEIKFAAEQSGSSIESFANSMFRANRRIANATTGTGPAVRALKDLGLSAAVLNNATTDERFMAIAQALSQMTDKTLAAQYGFEIFGNNFRDIKPLIDEGADGIANLRMEAQELGITMTDDDANAAAALTDAMNRLRQAIKGTVFQIGAALAPVVQGAITAFVDIAKSVVKFVRVNRELILAVGAGVAAGLILATTFIAVGTALTVAGIAVSGFVALFGVLGSILAFLLSPLGIVLVSVAALVGLAIYAAGGIGELTDAFRSLGRDAIEAWGGIVDAIRAGNLQLAGEIAFAALEVGWLMLTTSMKEVWSTIADFVKNIWLDVVKYIIDTGASIYFGIASTFDKLGAALASGFDIGLTYIQGAIDNIQTMIAKAIIATQRFFGMYSKEEAAQIQQILDHELARRAEGRQRGLDSRAQERASGIAERDQSRRTTQDQFSQTVADMLNERRSRTVVDRTGLDEAQKRLASLTSRAADEAAKVDEERNRQQQEPPLMDSFESATKAKAIGTSSAAAVAAGALGFSSRPMEDTARNTAMLVKYARRGANAGGFR